MTGKSDAFETDLLELIFTAVDIANLADDTVTSPAGTLTIALHTADPTDAGDQTSSETAYTGYARVAVTRDGTGWTVTGDTVNPDANIDFGECSAAAGGPITHFSIGTGTGDYMIYSGTVTPNITMAVGVIPRLKTTSAIDED